MLSGAASKTGLGQFPTARVQPLDPSKQFGPTLLTRQQDEVSQDDRQHHAGKSVGVLRDERRTYQSR
jgi:hypothetical protein